MKNKLDWKGVGQFVAVLVKLWSIIKVVMVESKVGLEILEWIIGEGVENFKAGLRTLLEEYKKSPDRGAEPEVVIDPIIRVNRSVKPSYPEWASVVVRPELELTGPAEYNITTVDQWLHDSQKSGGCIKGLVIHNYLKDTDALETCLGLRDLEEIRRRGIVFFRKHFKGKAVFGWRSLVRNLLDKLCAPYLRESGGEVVLGWSQLEIGCDGNCPALRFGSPQV